MLRVAATQAGVLKKACYAGLLTAIFCTTSVHAQSPQVATDMHTVAVAQLPPQGRATYRLIHQGGPFPYDKDGVVFGNRERLLPAHPRGYYREYTVPTSGIRGRGGKRIVCGGPATTPAKCYYTADHYASFRTVID